MKLYKNVDIVDLESILDKGILSMNESGNDNWMSDKRADNSGDTVYLFKSLSDFNTFVNYGVALIEVEVEEAEKQEMKDNDVNLEKYEEYTVERVNKEQIKAVYIPSLFKEYVEIPESVSKKVTWCEMEAKAYDELSDEYTPCTQELLERFAKTAQVEDTKEFNFFRGKNEDRTVIDLQDVKYFF